MLGRWVLTIALGAGLAVAAPGLSYSATKPVAFEVIRTVDVGGTEIIAVTPDGRFLATTNGSEEEVGLYDIGELDDIKQVCTVDLSVLGEPTSVAIHPTGKYGLIAIKNDPDPGTVLAFAIPSCNVLWQVPVGIGPDSVVISPNGQYAAVAIEDEEEEVDDPTDCPAGNVRPGRVDILRLNGSAQSAPTVTPVAIDLDDVANVGCPDDPQPEGIAISPNNQVAYVTLQENNALAMIDLKDARVASIISLGLTSHRADIVDDGQAQVNDNFQGRREPDGIAFSADGRWLFTADEGDTGNTDAFSGGRTMTVLATGKLEHSKQKQSQPPAVVTDTGALIEETAAANNALVSSRADNRGPEPEGITTFKVKQTEFAAVTLERYNALIIFNVEDTDAPSVAGFVQTGTSPEGVVYVPARRLLITSNEVAGTITFICAELDGTDCE